MPSRNNEVVSRQGSNVYGYNNNVSAYVCICAQTKTLIRLQAMTQNFDPLQSVVSGPRGLNILTGGSTAFEFDKI